MLWKVMEGAAVEVAGVKLTLSPKLLAQMTYFKNTLYIQYWTFFISTTIPL